MRWACARDTHTRVRAHTGSFLVMTTPRPAVGVAPARLALGRSARNGPPRTLTPSPRPRHRHTAAPGAHPAPGQPARAPPPRLWDKLNLIPPRLSPARSLVGSHACQCQKMKSKKKNTNEVRNAFAKKDIEHGLDLETDYMTSQAARSIQRSGFRVHARGLLALRLASRSLRLAQRLALCSARPDFFSPLLGGRRREHM